ncbi:hypothetical protein PL321_05390 [Caloramator sp. mosi_1]|uniref:hypothetical protein n=1 Tax=Caloramator sp. mosi_1 TaxID=3023090 RepID=UPI002360E7DC|nr:hypothetical protein [Caloramator sp. mosi_1]WDC84983.1 hypothetical protein PL321_05390 [Caloramator sp. mosi_1]
MNTENTKLTATLDVNVVEAGTFAGYKAVADATKLDLNTNNKDNNPRTATITVYKVDNNGNYIGVEGAVVLEDEQNNNAVNVTTSSAIVTANAVGTETVTVKVGTVKVGTITFNVVNTTPVLSTVSQVKNAIKVTTGSAVVTNALFGTDKNGGVFVGYDQYGEKIAFSANDYRIYSSNESVVDNSGNAISRGKATLSIVINKIVYIVEVLVD